jgi:hypothetical protein
MLPWIVYLVLNLPDEHHSREWKVAWVGFDIALLTGFGATAWLGWRRHRAAVPVTIATATLLCCDAWFDVTLDWSSSDRWLSLLSAVLVEVPLAVFLILRARHLLGTARPRSAAPDRADRDRADRDRADRDRADRDRADRDRADRDRADRARADRDRADRDRADRDRADRDRADREGAWTRTFDGGARLSRDDLDGFVVAYQRLLDRFGAAPDQPTDGRRDMVIHLAAFPRPADEAR